MDPLLGPLTENGGPTRTHALLAGSPAIDAADPSSFPATDQRGVSRVDGDGDLIATADIGAFEFEPGDCNGNGTPDNEDIASGSSLDCNGNGVPDECDIDPTDPDGNGLVSSDCNGNSAPDECEPDCNANAVPDDCDIDPGDPDGNGLVSSDCNGNSTPDECEPDCNANAVPDDCDIDLADPDGNGQVSADCNGNGTPDECDVNPADPDENAMVSTDCDGNGVPDECEADCNANTVVDACDIDPADPDGDGLVSEDCNANGMPDECEADCNGNDVIDECELSSVIFYDILADDLVNVSMFCGSGQAINNERTSLGFAWTDVGTGVARNADVEFNLSMNCHAAGTVHTTTLNGIPDATFPTSPNQCRCLGAGNGTQRAIAGNGDSYAVGQTNTFLITGLATTLGFTPNTAWGAGVYARVTVDYDLTAELDANGNGILDECEAAGDLNGDGFVDLTDYMAYEMCLAGPAVMVPEGCSAADMNGNGSVDLNDFANQQNGFTGNGP